MHVDFSSLKIHWQKDIEKNLNKSITLKNVKTIGGGSINNAYSIETNLGMFFVKVNLADKFPEMFEAEKKGLDLLRNNSFFIIPNVISLGETDGNSWLIMEFIHEASRKSDFWKTFGENLAGMHGNSHSQFGLDHNNYIGTLPQNNNFRDSWTDFFIEMRLEPQLKLAVDSKKLNSMDVKHFHRLFEKLQQYFPEEKPSLVHGDLWSGNFAIDKNGNSCIFDPAVYYGHREMDIAMTKLFGGFDKEFYESYNRELPMEKQWEERMDLYNLYPLLVHVNLFGGGYTGQIIDVLKRFT